MRTKPAPLSQIGPRRLPHSSIRSRYHVRAQNGPGIAVVEHRPGPDLSASLDYTEEH